MLNDSDHKILKKALLQNKSQMNYYLVLAVLLIVLSWGLFFSLQRPAAFILAILFSVALWYYPWLYYKKTKAIRLDLVNKEKNNINTSIYGKSISKINKLQPYYFIYTEEEDFEVDKYLYNVLKEGQLVRIIYAAESKTILDIKRLEH